MRSPRPGRRRSPRPSVIGLDQFDIDGNGEVVGDVGTNADLVLGGNAKVCGNVTHGVGRGVQTSSNAEVCSGYMITEGTFSLSPPDPGDVATNNDNDRFFTLDPKVGNVTWDSSTRSLALSGNSALTLGGGNYSFCQLTMSGNSNIYIANGAVVRIYFDSPENCGQSGGVEQLSMTGNSEISATVGDAGDVGMLFVGSSTTPTTVKLAGNGKANEVMIYAPRSDVKISGNGNYTGAIAGKTIVDTGNGTITAHASTLDFQVTVSTAYSREKLVECVGALTTSDPSERLLIERASGRPATNPTRIPIPIPSDRPAPAGRSLFGAPRDAQMP